MSACRIGHVFVHDLMNSPRDLLNIHAEPVTDALERVPRAIDIQPHVATEKIVRVEIPQNEIRIGHRTTVPALTVTDRATARARTLRPYAEPANRIHAPDA